MSPRRLLFLAAAAVVLCVAAAPSLGSGPDDDVAETYAIPLVEGEYPPVVGSALPLANSRGAFGTPFDPPPRLSLEERKEAWEEGDLERLFPDTGE